MGLVIALVSATSAAPTNNKTIDDLQQKRNVVRSERANAANRVNALEATNAEVTQALDDLHSNLAGITAQLEDAQRAIETAENDLTAAKEREQKAQDELDEIHESFKDQAIQAYVSSNDDAGLEILSAVDMNEAVNKQTVLQMRANQDLDAIERYRTVQAELEDARIAAEKATERAEQKRREAEQRLDEYNKAEAQYNEFAAAVDERLDTQLSEAQSLAELDNALSSKISSEQAALAAKLNAAYAANAARASAAGQKYSGGGSVTLPATGSKNIVSVRGIRVSSTIAGPLERLLAAAAADGISLSGGGYRDSANQIRLRRQNCGSSNYAVYQMSASRCSPPTARPGASMHERGLAIDFTQGGRALNRSSSGYRWLKGNAHRFGFKNLPSEAWHWSTTGR